MNQQWRIYVAVVVMCATGAASRVQAQFGPYNSPISPYMNLLYPGASPAVNYFNLVQPQLEFNAAIGALQSQQVTMGQTIAAGTFSRATGHPVLFGNYSHYYSRGLGTGRSGSGMGGMGMGGMGMGGMGMGGMGMGGMGMGGSGMGGMGMGGMGMGGMGMGGMGMGGMGMGGMGMGGMGMGGMIR